MVRHGNHSRSSIEHSARGDAKGSNHGTDTYSWLHHDGSLSAAFRH